MLFLTLSKIKLIASDVDGTLLDAHSRITAATKAKLIDVQKQGIPFVLASGRAPFELQDFIKELHLQELNGYAIHTNGAGILLCGSGEEFHFPKISLRHIRYMIQVAHLYGLYVIINHKGRYLCSYQPWLAAKRTFAQQHYEMLRATSWQRVRQFAYMSIHAQMVEHLEDILEEDANKICVRGNPKKLKAFHQHLLQVCPNCFNYFYVTKSSLEITHHEVSKAKALLALCEHLHIHPNEVAAFGDSNNDDEMLASVKYGVAMGNALSQTKACASYETKTNDEDGIVYFLNQIK